MRYPAGADSIVGGEGRDAVSYAASNAAVTVNLSLATPQFGGHAAGDILHIGNALEGFPGDGDINDFLRIVSVGGQSRLQLDFDGTEAVGSFVDIAILKGVSGVSVSRLYANGQIDTLPIID